MPRADRLALLLSLAAVAAAWMVAGRVFENLPHIEDEMAFSWQAQVLAQGRLALPSPPAPKSIMVPFVVDYRGERFSKYPPGWPILLMGGLLMGGRNWVNPILAGLGVWLTYRLGQKLFDPKIGLLAAGLTLSSPFFLLNSGSLLSHPWSLVLSLSFTLAWLDTISQREGNTEGIRRNSILPPSWLTVSVAGLSLGVLALTRPLTAVGVGLPFLVHGSILLGRGDRPVRLRLLAIGMLAAGVAALLFAWQFAATGTPWLNLYTLWWKYDKVGFGLGFGRQAGGHDLHWAVVNLLSSLRTGRRDLFGWGNISWLFLPFGLWAARRTTAAWPALSVFPALVLVYMTYWIGSNLYGPRYYYEGLYSLTLTSAAGIFWFGNEVFSRPGWQRLQRVAAAMLVAFLVGYNLTVYLPHRLGEMRGLYGITRSMLAPFETAEARALGPALVVVHFKDEWTEYGGLLELENAELSSPFIFAISRGAPADAALAKYFPERRILHYYPDEPDQFYTSPR
jgi:hypothetical protein